MSESLTGNDVVVPASEEPTGQATAPQTAESLNQETISTEQSNQSNESTSQEAVSTDTAQNQNNGGVAVDDGLAKFAKSQGFEDFNSLSDREKKLLKIASDNQKAYRSSQNAPKIADTVKELTKPADDADDNEKFRSEFNQFRYEQKTNSFWNDERNKELEPTMVQILNEKKEQFGSEYARNLSNDLETLYGMAQLKTGNTSGPIVDENKIRQEERDSINKQLTSGAPQAHAVAQSVGTPKIDSEWIENTYEPGNAEHEKMLQEAMAAQRSEQY